MPVTAEGAMGLILQATVQIVAGRRTGTGFFVARHIIATCAHVLPERKKKVTIYSGRRKLTGTVLQRLPANGRGTNYPYPDLGLVGVDESVDRPHAEIWDFLLRHGEGKETRLLAFGFNRAAPDPTAGPDIVELTVVGPSGKFVKASTNGVEPGMSGAPIVHPEYGYVCGILKYYVPQQNAAWFVDAWELRSEMVRNERLLGQYAPPKPSLRRPEPGHPLHRMLTAQAQVAEKLPYQVVKGKVPLSAVYVEQRTEAWQAERQRAAVRRQSLPTEPDRISPYEMLSRHRNALVVGGPGGGKSTLLQHLVLESVDWWLSKAPAAPGEEPVFGPAVAIRCPATRLLTGKPWYQAIAEAVNSDLHGFQVTPLTSEIFAKPPVLGAEWLILVDGLDEVHNPDKRQELIEILAERIAEYGNQVRFAVTSRPLADTEFRRLHAQLTGGQRADRLGEYNLRPFDPGAVRKFAAKWFELRAPDRKDELTAGFLESIDDNRMLPLVTIPLLGTIAADVYQHDPDAPLPAERTGLYSRFVDGLLYGRGDDPRQKLRDELKPLGRTAEDFGDILFEQRRACVAHLAEVRLTQDRQPSVALARQWLVRKGIDVPPAITDDHIREALLSSGLLVNRGDGLEFTHQSIAEYLVARAAGPHFDEQAWLDRVRARGTESLRLFELANWADAGNDATPVVQPLSEPGHHRTYPHLPQLAAVLEDGAAGDATPAVLDMAIKAVKDIDGTDEATLPVINQAARAVLQRAADAQPLLRVVANKREATGKRIEVAKVLVAQGDDEVRQQGLDALIRLGYRSGLDGLQRLPTLRALAETAGRAERVHAIQHIASLVETGDPAGVRMAAIHVLIALNEPGEALVAMIRRLVDPDRTEAELSHTLDEIEELDNYAFGQFVDEKDEHPPVYETGAVSPGLAWTTPRTVTTDDPTFQYFPTVLRLATLVGWMAGALDPAVAGTAVARMMRNRSLTWGERAAIARYVSSEEHPFLSRLAFDELAGDRNTAPEVRIVNRWLHRRRTDPAGAEAILKETVADRQATIAERHCALNVMMSRGSGRSAIRFVADCAGNPELPPQLRIAAGAMLGRHPRSYPEGLALLRQMAADPALTARWRWTARTARVATLLEPPTAWLTAGTHLDDAVRHVWWSAHDRFARLLGLGEV